MSPRHALVALTAAMACAVAPAGAAASPAVPAEAGPARGAKAPAPLAWKPCGDAANVTCATVKVPRDYERPQAATLSLFVAKSPATDPAHRIGSLFVNPGGPGASVADSIEALGADYLPALNARFDIIAMDPRGVGQSTPAIDCAADQETSGIYAQPFTTPDNLDVFGLLAKDTRYVARCVQRNRDLLRDVSTANVARDMDLLRRALGERRITYVGFSYGTFLGATYARLFPSSYRAMVLDGPVDADAYMNDPMRLLSAQSTGFERALGRFFEACGRDQAACSDFGGDDPRDAYDDLLESPRRVAGRARGRACRRRRRRPGRDAADALQQGELAVSRAGARGARSWRRLADADSPPTCSTGATRTARTRPGRIATSRSARSSRPIPVTSARTCGPAGDRGTSTSTSGGTTATSS